MTAEPKKKKLIIYSGGKMGTHALTIAWSPFVLATSHYFYARPGGVYDTTHVSEARLHLTAHQLIERKTSPIVLDIESPHFSFTRDYPFAYQNFKLAIDTFRAYMPGTRFAFYRHIPIRDYWSVVNYRNNPENAEYKARFYAWKHVNAKHQSYYVDDKYQGYQGLADLVDFVNPSIYTFYDNVKDDLIYKRENLRQSRRYNKPVIAYVWAHYHTSNAALKYQYIGDDYWRAQLELIKSMEIEGIMIYNGQPAEFNPPESAVKILEEVLG